MSIAGWMNRVLLLTSIRYGLVKPSFLFCRMRG